MLCASLDYLERVSDGWLFRFSAGLHFELVKDHIKTLPREHRYWNSRALGGRGAWWVSDEGLAQIAGIFINYADARRAAEATYARWHGSHQQQQQNQQQSHSYQRPQEPRRGMMTREQAFAQLYLLPTAPKEVAQAVHRALAKKFHPDLGGDLEQMKQINLAWDVVEASYPK